MAPKKSTLPDEAELLALFRRIAQGGDRAADAMDELTLAAFRPLCGFFRTMGFDGAESEDLAQEVLVRLLQAELEEVRLARAWLFQVARRIAIDAFRRRGPLLYVEGQAAEVGGEEPGPSAEDAAHWRDTDIDVLRAMERVRQRNLDWFIALQCAAMGLSGKELAVALKRDREGTANQLLSEARQALRETYAQLTGERGPGNGRSLPE